MKLYRGVVEDNQDPSKYGRVRVRIQGMHTAKNENSGEAFNYIKTSDLPWAEVMGGNQFGLIGGVGISSILRQGTWVWVVLEEENPNKPIVIGTMVGNATTSTSYAAGEGFNDPSGVHPKTLNHSDINSALDTKYTTLATLETESGHLIELDDTPSDERIKITHKTGSSVEIDSAGNMLIHTVGNLTYNVDGNLQYTVTGTTTFDSTGDYAVTAPRIDLN